MATEADIINAARSLVAALKAEGEATAAVLRAKNVLAQAEHSSHEAHQAALGAKERLVRLSASGVEAPKPAPAPVAPPPVATPVATPATVLHKPAPADAPKARRGREFAN